MRDPYLWDGSGAPDPEVERLERLLREFRSDRVVPELRREARPRWRAVAAAAAAVALAVAGAWLVAGGGGAPEGWQVALAGAGRSRLAVGQTLETGAGGHATMNVGRIGVVEVEANSLLRLERARAGEQRMALEHGLIHAFILAPPRSFVVDTPSAVATDLGCFYTLEVGKDGSGLVRVQAGWVSFADAGRESFIPAGAACRTRRGSGPGTPWREQASPALRAALQDFDFAGGGDGALSVVLAEATKDDAFTLWHLLTRVTPAQEPRVYDALAALAPPPVGVTREGILRRDPQMLGRWWDQLGLGQTGWWRRVERKLP
jgi:hypothetical protein